MAFEKQLVDLSFTSEDLPHNSDFVTSNKRAYPKVLRLSWWQNIYAYFRYLSLLFPLSNHLQGLCDCWNRLFELYTRQIATVPEFWGHADNKALRLAILFLETRRNHKGPNQVGGGQQPFCQLPEIAAVTQQSWFHHHSRQFWQTCSLRHCKMAQHWSSYIVLQNFSTFSSVWLWEGWPHAHILQGTFQHIWTKKNHSKVHVLCMRMTLKAVLN